MKNEYKFALKIIKDSNQRKYLFKWIKTLHKEMKPIPWLTFGAINLLNAIELESKNIFEWGSGGSTLYWLKRGANVVSIEHDQEWYNKVKSNLITNEKIDYQLIKPEYNEFSKSIDYSHPDNYISSESPEYNFNKYVSYIDKFEDEYFDVILIDGRARPSCIKHAVDKLKCDGILIIDNSDRDYYFTNTIQYLKDFTLIRYKGVLPYSCEYGQTSIYRKLLSPTQIDCETEFHGTHYGGWSIKKNSIDENSIVYSFGVGTDISFDIALIEKYNSDIYAFDPTPKSINWIKEQKLPDKFHFLDYGIAANDGTITFFAPDNSSHVSYTTVDGVYKTKPYEGQVKKIATIMRELNHDHIDIFKMDIEGTEYQVIDDLISSGIKPNQILIEFHHRFTGIGIDKTLDTIKKLNDYGYRVFKVSDSNEEISFILC